MSDALTLAMDWTVLAMEVSLPLAMFIGFRLWVGWLYERRRRRLLATGGGQA